MHMKDESEEFCRHTPPIHLTTQWGRNKKPPSGHTKKKNLCQICFPLSSPCSSLFPLALFFKAIWALWRYSQVFRQPTDFPLSRAVHVYLIYSLFYKKLQSHNEDTVISYLNMQHLLWNSSQACHRRNRVKFVPVLCAKHTNKTRFLLQHLLYALLLWANSYICG